LGAAWIANTYTRFAIPYNLTGLCLFTGRDTQSQWPNGDWGIVTRDNRAKASFNVFKLFNTLESHLLVNNTDDGSVSYVATVDPTSGRIAIVLVNFYEGGGPPLDVELHVTGMHKAVGNYTVYLVDPDHCNLFEPGSDGELSALSQGSYEGGSVVVRQRLRNNAVMLVAAG
jgi:hypothetical protein